MHNCEREQYCWGFFSLWDLIISFTTKYPHSLFLHIYPFRSIFTWTAWPHNRKHHTRIVLFMHDTDLIFILSFNLIFSVDSSDGLFYLGTAGELPCTWCNLILKQTGKRCKTTFVFGNLMFPEFYQAVTVTPKKSSNKCCSI